MVRMWPVLFLSLMVTLASASAADSAKTVPKTVPVDTAGSEVPAPSVTGEDLENEAENEFLNSSEAPDADDIELEN